MGSKIKKILNTAHSPVKITTLQVFFRITMLLFFTCVIAALGYEKKLQANDLIIGGI